MSATFGQQIRARREELGLTLQDAAHRTRIPVEWICRLENEDFLSFGSLAYARSFVRSYSRFLEVDSSLVELELKCAEAAKQSFVRHPHSVQAKGTRPARRRAPMAAMAAITFLVLGVSLGVQTLAQKAQSGGPVKRYPIVQSKLPPSMAVSGSRGG